MSTLTVVKDTLNIVNAAGTLLKSNTARNAISTVNRVSKAASHVTGVGGSIASVSAQTNIMSRVFVEETVLDEPVLSNLIKTCHDWYAAQIISALQVSQMVTEHRSVQQMLSLVQTGQNEREKSMVANLSKEAALGLRELNRRYNGQESFLANYVGEAAVEAFSSYGPNTIKDQTQHIREDLGLKQAKREAAAFDNPNTASVRSVKPSENKIGPMGELFEVTLTNPNDKGLSLKVPIYIQMQPSIVPASIAARFIDMNVPASTWQRWTQMRAGELSFWKDFIFQRDHILRLKAISKDPATAAAFNDFQKTIAKKDRYALGDVTDRTTANHSQNLANSVVIFTEDTVAQAKSDSGIDLHNEADRKRYFRNAYAMIVIVVDPMHQRVTIYFNGIDGALNCSYSEFKPKDSKFDPNEFMQALTAFSTNSIGRLR